MSSTVHIQTCRICLSAVTRGIGHVKGKSEIIKQSAAKSNEIFHAFHKACLRPWIGEHNNCPLCRGSLVLKPKVPMKTKVANFFREIAEFSKRGLLNSQNVSEMAFYCLA